MSPVIRNIPRHSSSPFIIPTSYQYCFMDTKLETWKLAKRRGWILSIYWSNFVPNKEVRKQSRCSPLSSLICKQCLNWLGHVCRLLTSWLVNQVLHWVPSGQRRWGRLKMKWWQSFSWDLKLVNHHWNDVFFLAKSRRNWSTLTALCVSRYRNH